MIWNRIWFRWGFDVLIIELIVWQDSIDMNNLTIIPYIWTFKTIWIIYDTAYTSINLKYHTILIWCYNFCQLIYYLNLFIFVICYSFLNKKFPLLFLHKFLLIHLISPTITHSSNFNPLYPQLISVNNTILYLSHHFTQINTHISLLYFYHLIFLILISFLLFSHIIHL
jgi:hypothetical protein